MKSSTQRVGGGQALRRRLIFSVMVLVCAPIASAADQWAVVIGISKFSGLPESQHLDYAHSDARLFADTLKSRRIGVPPDNVRLLLDEEATTRNIKHAMGSWLRNNAGPEDTVYLFIASHGVVTQRNEAYFITYDTDPKSLYATAFPMGELRRVLDGLPAKHLILASDACKSGNVGSSEFSSRDLEMPAINDHFKGLLPVNESPQPDPGLDSANQEVQPSRFVLTAAGSYEKSYEGEQWGGGVFTHFLVEGLKGRADRNSDGRVDANELLDFVRDNVRKETDSKQNPMVASSDYDGRLVLSGQPGPGPFRDALPVRADPRSAPPDRVRPASGTPGALVLSCSLSNVQLKIDGQPQASLSPGQSRLIPLPAGPHLVFAEKDGFDMAVVQVDLPAGRQLVHALKLSPTFPSPAADLRVRLDNGLEEYKMALEAEDQAAQGEATQSVLAEIEAVLDDLLAIQDRSFLPQERNLIRDAAATLFEEYARVGQKDRFGQLMEKCFQAFPFLPVRIARSSFPENLETSAIQPGFVNLRIEDQAAHVDIDSVYYGLLQPGEAEILLPAGNHSLTVRRQGFAPFRQEFGVAPGEGRDVQAQLALENIDVFAFSQTGEVRMSTSLGSEVAFVSLQEMLQSPLLMPGQKDRLRQEAQARGLGDRIWVARLADVQLGTAPIELTFARDLHESQRAALDLKSGPALNQATANLGDFFLEGNLRLEPLQGTLKVVSQPAGAAVWLDSDEIGVTPLEITRRVGDYELKIGKGRLRYRQSLSIEKDQIVEIDRQLKPPLVFLGLHSSQLEREKMTDLEEQIEAKVSQAFQNYDALNEDASKYEYTLDFLQETVQAANHQSPQAGKHLEALAERYDADVFLMGYFASEKDFLGGRLDLLLFSTLSRRADVRKVRFRTMEEIEEYLKSIDSATVRQQDLFQPDIGLKTLDTTLPGRSLVVMATDPDGPAAAAGIGVGDVILSFNDQAVDSASLFRIVNQSPPGTSFRLEISQGASQESLEVKSRPLPRLLIEPDSKALLNALVFQLELLREEQPSGDSLELGIIRLNTALAYIGLEDWKAAIETLNRVGGTSPQREVLQAPIHYFRGYCFEKLDEIELARESYRDASQQANRSLHSAMRFDFQDLAVWRLKYLP